METKPERDVTSLDNHRILKAHRRLAASVAGRLSTIRCETHGRTAVAAWEVDDEGSRRYSYSDGPCCAAHAGQLHVARDKIERELMESTGYLRALLIAADDDR